jgi:hypothetical protein
VRTDLDAPPGPCRRRSGLLRRRGAGERERPASSSACSACAFEARLYDHSGTSPQELRNYFEQVHAFYDALPAERFPVLASVAAELSGPGRDERFDFGLNAMIAGLEALSAAG